jgi:YesN/AraC family two-component response regulator
MCGNEYEHSPGISPIELQLTKLGYKVSGKAVTGRDAIALTNETNPEAVLMDIYFSR